MFIVIYFNSIRRMFVNIKNLEKHQGSTVYYTKHNDIWGYLQD